MGFIDCDSHVIEDDHTWSYIDPSERDYAPKTVEFRERHIPGAPPRKLWLVGDEWAARFEPSSDFRGNGNNYDPGVTTLTDPAARIEDLDALGIDVQVLISTFFLGVELEHPLAEAALKRSWNRWMADRTQDSGGRLRWTVCAPTRMIDRALEELDFGKEHGAVGVHLSGMDHGYYLADPVLHPLYDKAQDLDLAIIVHIGTSVRRQINVPIGELLPDQAAFLGHLGTLMQGFHSVLASDLHLRFPRLRFGFLEGGAAWVPAVLGSQERLAASQSDWNQVPITPGQLAEKNLFVACLKDEDLSYLAGALGDATLIIGSDYGHNDSGTTIPAHSAILRRRDIPRETADRIVDSNARRLYQLDDAFRPANPVPGTFPTVPHVRMPAAIK